jgi:hypothetical protein
METTNKYDLRAINWAQPEKPHFLAKSRDNKLIYRKDEAGNFLIISEDQTVFTELSAENARDLALWLLIQTQ